ncbi:hypothetical protein CMUS01_04286 [Colletotrichum musicola]|uniref:Uncharacterized protein n=1 Tax=Colletotrichum musicola TaxID=2175873 RepID=A0A8H6KY80_9PEZI|nr:hypothetical protein CMUS01_04286 [Colletotrichum musicola]
MAGSQPGVSKQCRNYARLIMVAVRVDMREGISRDAARERIGNSGLEPAVWNPGDVSSNPQAAKREMRRSLVKHRELGFPDVETKRRVTVAVAVAEAEAEAEAGGDEDERERGARDPDPGAGDEKGDGP